MWKSPDENTTCESIEKYKEEKKTDNNRYNMFTCVLTGNNWYAVTQIIYKICFSKKIIPETTKSKKKKGKNDGKKNMLCHKSYVNLTIRKLEIKRLNFLPFTWKKETEIVYFAYSNRFI